MSQKCKIVSFDYLRELVLVVLVGIEFLIVNFSYKKANFTFFKFDLIMATISTESFFFLN